MVVHILGQFGTPDTLHAHVVDVDVLSTSLLLLPLALALHLLSPIAPTLPLLASLQLTPASPLFARLRLACGDPHLLVVQALTSRMPVEYEVQPEVTSLEIQST